MSSSKRCRSRRWWTCNVLLVTGSATSNQQPGSLVESEPDLHLHLVLRDLSVRNAAAQLCDLEPVDMAQRLRCALDSGGYCGGERNVRRADDLHELVNLVLIRHRILPKSEFYWLRLE